MIGLDTNILIRYITQDDAAQSRRANRLIAGLNEAEPGFIGIVTVVELVWVLGSFYGFADEDIASAIEHLLAGEGFAVEHERDVFGAVATLRQGADFADALIGASGVRARCTHTLTFDRKAARLPGFELVS